jgi:hypothetical protein
MDAFGEFLKEKWLGNGKEQFLFTKLGQMVAVIVFFDSIVFSYKMKIFIMIKFS